MVIRDLLDEVLSDVSDADEDVREKLLRFKLTLLEDKILKVTNYIKKTYKTVVPASLQVRLPYDFRYPVLAKRNDAIITRYDPGAVGTDATRYSTEYKRLDLSNSKELIIKPFDFEYANIEIERSTSKNGYGFNIMSADGTVKFGEILDNENIYYPESLTNETEFPIKIVVLDTGDDVAKYSDVVRYIDDDALELLTTFGNYQIPLMEGVKEYYLAENGFTYSDAGLTTLVSRGRIKNNNLLLVMGSPEADDEIEINYVASAQQYINENQISILADTFHDLMYNGLMYEAYAILKKGQKMAHWLKQYNEALRLAIPEAARVNTLGKVRYNRRTGKMPRLPFQ